MKTVKPIDIICLALTMGLNGCATGRIADLRDCGRISVGAGPAFGVEVRAGALTHLSLGVSSAENAKRYGLEDRYVYGRWVETEAYWPVCLIWVAFLQESTTNPVASLATTYVRDIDHDWLINPPPYRIGHLLNLKNNDNPRSSFLKHATDVECGVAPLLFSARIGVNPIEIADFLLGFIGLDICGDNTKEPTTPSTLRHEARRK